MIRSNKHGVIYAQAPMLPREANSIILCREPWKGHVDHRSIGSKHEAPVYLCDERGATLSRKIFVWDLRRECTEHI